MPDGHLLSAEQKVGKDSPKRTKVLLENSPSGGIAIPPERPPSTGALPPKRFKSGDTLRRRVGLVRVPSGHLREAEAPTEATAENSVPARKVGTIRNRKTIVWG